MKNYLKRSQMKIDKSLILSFVAPLMICFSTSGLLFKQDNKKIFYVPIGLMGIFIIFEKDIGRKLNRRLLLKKIRSYKNCK